MCKARVSPVKNDYARILVHSLVNLGDVLLSTSAVALLRQIYPQAHITMMVRSVAAELVQNNPIIDEVIVYDYNHTYKSMRRTIAFIGELRQKKFDLCISFDRKLRPALLVLLAGIPVRVGPNRIFDDKPSWVTKLYTHTITLRQDIVNTHQAENYQEIVRGFSSRTGSAKPVIGTFTAKNQRTVSQLLSVLPEHHKHIALCVKGTFSLKNWPQQSFAALVDNLAVYTNCSFFIIGAPEDKPYAEQLIAMTKTPIENFCGCTTLMDLVALFHKTDLLLTVDTGAMHIAATTDVPIIAIFGCTNPQRWHPLSNTTTILSRNLPCCPCAIPADACPKHACIAGITIEQVYNEMITMI